MKYRYICYLLNKFLSHFCKETNICSIVFIINSYLFDNYSNSNTYALNEKMIFIIILQLYHFSLDLDSVLSFRQEFTI